MFNRIKNNNKAFIVLFILVLISIVVMLFLDSFLITESAPNGIVSFELAKYFDKSIEIINSWDSVAKTSAGLSMGFDFLFLLIYSSFIWLLIVRINQYLFVKDEISFFEKTVLALPFLAAFFDVLENIALIKLLLGDLEQIWSSLAYYFATIKFGLLFVAIAYILIGGVILIFKKRKK
ncbi:MAG: hypothetical protein HF967_06305 [Methanosarcinales archaeon]|nr:hypothetical protein [Methanosarcinales archaeon]